MLPSNCQHNFAMYLSSLVTLVYKGLTFHRDLSKLEESSPSLPSVMCLMTSTPIRQGMYYMAITSE
jgi:hypothetical protein